MLIVPPRWKGKRRRRSARGRERSAGDVRRSAYIRLDAIAVEARSNDRDGIQCRNPTARCVPAGRIRPGRKDRRIGQARDATAEKTRVGFVGEAGGTVIVDGIVVAQHLYRQSGPRDRGSGSVDEDTARSVAGRGNGGSCQPDIGVALPNGIGVEARRRHRAPRYDRGRAADARRQPDAYRVSGRSRGIIYEAVENDSRYRADCQIGGIEENQFSGRFDARAHGFVDEYRIADPQRRARAGQYTRDFIISDRGSADILLGVGRASASAECPQHYAKMFEASPLDLRNRCFRLAFAYSILRGTVQRALAGRRGLVRCTTQISRRADRELTLCSVAQANSSRTSRKLLNSEVFSDRFSRQA